MILALRQLFDLHDTVPISGSLDYSDYKLINEPMHLIDTPLNFLKREFHRPEYRQPFLTDTIGAIV